MAEELAYTGEKKKDFHERDMKFWANDERYNRALAKSQERDSLGFEGWQRQRFQKNERLADEAHREMQDAAEEGMRARRAAAKRGPARAARRR